MNLPVFCALGFGEDKGCGNHDWAHMTGHRDPGEPRWGPKLASLPTSQGKGRVASLKPKTGPGSLRHVCLLEHITSQACNKAFQTAWANHLDSNWQYGLGGFPFHFLGFMIFFLPLFKEHFYKLVFYIALPVLWKKDKYFQCVFWGISSHWENVSLMDVAILTSLAG